MSIDLDLEALGRAARACKDTADTFEKEADSALESARTLGLGWQGEGYAAFAEKVELSAVPMAHAAADASRSLAEGMEEAHELGESLLLRAENFGYDLGGTGGGSGGSRLFFDEDVIDPIEADIINTETSLAAAQTAFMKAEAALSRLTTCSVTLDSEGFSAGLANISRGLDTYKESLSAYRSGMEELEALSARVAQEASSAFSVKSVSCFFVDELTDPSKPWELASGGYSILSAKAFNDAGIKGNPTFRIENGKVIFSDYKWLDDPPKLPPQINISNIPKSPGASLAVEGFHCEKVAKNLGYVGDVISVGNAWFDEYNANPSLPEERRISDANVEAAIEGGGSLLSSALAGAATGFVVGSAVPGLGTLAGTVTGAIAGVVSGWVAGEIWDDVNKEVIHHEGADGRSAADDIKDWAWDIQHPVAGSAGDPSPSVTSGS